MADAASTGSTGRGVGRGVDQTISPDARLHTRHYTGRFAPSPTGPLHAGSMVAALASWLDARAHRGRWLVRIEDIDTPRCVPGADQTILSQLAACGLLPDEPALRQSQRGPRYQQALDQLVAQRLAYPCACTRQDLAWALAASGQTRQRHGELVYPGTCRRGLAGRPARAWRFLTQTTDSAADVLWHDRLLGSQRQDVGRSVGDFVLRRADGFWAYQLAVVVDDADQGVTHVVRGQDLADNTARQVLLQAALGLPRPHYLHTPLVLGTNGEKLSKQNGAQALDTRDPVGVLRQAGQCLQLHVEGDASTPHDWLRQALPLWAGRHMAPAQQASTLKSQGD